MNILRCFFSQRTRSMLLAGVIASSALLPSARSLAAPVHGNSSTLIIGWPQSPQTFDPPVAPDNPSIWVLVNIYDQLLRTGNDGTSLHPDLATSWDISKDGKAYTFHLRPNAVFHDGTKVTASDVKFSLDRVRDPKNLWSYLYTAISAIDAVDPLTVRINLKYIWAPFLSDVAFFGGAIYPEAYFKKVGAKGLAAHPIGSGPYKFVSFNPTSTILTKNTSYFFASQFPMQGVEFRVISNDSSRLLQVQSGDIDVDNLLAPNLVANLKTSQSAQPLLSPSTIIRFLQPNHHVKPWGDLKVRQAVNHAIDRDQINKKVFYGYATPANSFMAKGAIAWDPNLPVPTHDLALAKKLMKESSVPNGFTMNYQVGSGNVADTQTAVFFQQQVAPLGIKVNIVPEDPTTLQNNSQVSKFDFFPQYWTNDIPDPDELVSYTNDPTVSNCYYTFCVDPMLATLSRQAERTTDQAKRTQIYYKLQEIFANDVPFFYTVYPPLINGVNNHVKGFNQNPLGYFVLSGITKS